MGERVRGYVWFTCFAVLLSGPMVLSSLLTRRWSAAFELDSHLLLYVIAVPRYCCSTWWVGALVVAPVRPWLIVCFAFVIVLWVVTIYLMVCTFFVRFFLSPAPLWHSLAYHLWVVTPGDPVVFFILQQECLLSSSW